MTETYQPPVRPMTEVLPRIMPELDVDSNFALLTMLQTFQRMDNHGFVTQGADGNYSFVSVPEQVAASFGGPAPHAEAFSFSSEDLLLQPDGTTVPFTNEAFTTAVGKSGASKIEIVRQDTQGVPHNFEIKLSMLHGNNILVAQINDISEKKLAEKLSRKIEQLDFLKKAKIEIDEALTSEMNLSKPTEASFINSAVNRIKVVLGFTDAGEIGFYDTTALQTESFLQINQLAATTDLHSITLPNDFIENVRQIDKDRFSAYERALPENSQGLNHVTAVAAFPESTDETVQKIMAVYSREELPQIVRDQLPYIMQEIKYALEKLRSSIALHAKLEKKNSELEQALIHARVDKLNSIPNRRWFVENLLAELSEIERNIEAGKEDQHIGLVFGDIDKFGAFNNDLGHNAGDIVLTSVAQSLNTNKRNEDFVARYGGEEFLMTLPNMNLAGSVAAAERQRLIIAEKPYKYGPGADQERPITMSFGVVPMEQLLSQIDLKDVTDAILNKGFIKFVTSEQVEMSKTRATPLNGNGSNGNGEAQQIIQPDLVYDPDNPRKSLHDLRLLIAFEHAHALASKVIHTAKDSGRNKVCRAEWNEIDNQWEAKGQGVVQIIDMSKIEYTDLIVQGSKEEFLAMLNVG